MTEIASAVLVDGFVDDTLGTELLAHLEVQLVSARRLLAIVLEQGVAIRSRNVHTVVETTGLLQAELQRRAMIDRERGRLLERAGLRLGIDPGAVSLTLMQQLLTPETGEAARARSAELQGMLAEVQREHHVNRALMNQELAFLDHLLRLVDSDRQVGYDSHTKTPAPPLAARHRVLDLEV